MLAATVPLFLMDQGVEIYLAKTLFYQGILCYMLKAFISFQADLSCLYPPRQRTKNRIEERISKIPTTETRLHVRC